MKKVSEQLSVLSDRAKKTEDFVASARQRDLAKITSDKAALEASVDAGTAKLGEGVRAGESKWNDARASLDARFANMKANAQERKFERDVKKAEHRADEAEADAADAVDFAIYVLDQAEYAVADAVIARADADALALNG
jgi:hypothetical protein